MKRPSELDDRDRTGALHETWHCQNCGADGEGGMDAIFAHIYACPRNRSTFYGHQGRRRGQVDSAEYLAAWCFLVLAGGAIVAVFVRAAVLLLK